MTEQHRVVTRQEWIGARKQLLAREKELTQLRDQLSEQRRALPWVRVDERYVFDGPNGPETLAEAFGGHRQLIVYHFMFGADWELPCKSCSFWADNFNGVTAHLEARDVSFAAISHAPVVKLQALARRLAWSFKWLSSQKNTFNDDYGVSLKPDQFAKGTGTYNYAPAKKPFDELPGISVFYKDESGALFHTYSCYSRGLDMMNTAYHYLDLVPKGRDEAGLPYTMAWLKLRDDYAR